MNAIVYMEKLMTSKTPSGESTAAGAAGSDTGDAALQTKVTELEQLQLRTVAQRDSYQLASESFRDALDQLLAKVPGAPAPVSGTAKYPPDSQVDRNKALTNAHAFIDAAIARMKADSGGRGGGGNKPVVSDYEEIQGEGAGEEEGGGEDHEGDEEEGGEGDDEGTGDRVVLARFTNEFKTEVEKMMKELRPLVEEVASAGVSAEKGSGQPSAHSRDLEHWRKRCHDMEGSLEEIRSALEESKGDFYRVPSHSTLMQRMQIRLDEQSRIIKELLGEQARMQVNAIAMTFGASTNLFAEDKIDGYVQKLTRGHLKLMQGASLHTRTELNDTTVIVVKTAAALLVELSTILAQQNANLNMQMNLMRERLGELFVYANNNDVPVRTVRPVPMRPGAPTSEGETAVCAKFVAAGLGAEDTLGDATSSMHHVQPPRHGSKDSIRYPDMSQLNLYMAGNSCSDSEKYMSNLELMFTRAESIQTHGMDLLKELMYAMTLVPMGAEWKRDNLGPSMIHLIRFMHATSAATGVPAMELARANSILQAIMDSDHRTIADEAHLMCETCRTHLRPTQRGPALCRNVAEYLNEEVIDGRLARAGLIDPIPAQWVD